MSETRGDHLDWFFSVSQAVGAPLVTWSTATGWPRFSGNSTIRLPPHRARYLDFDGEISGNRGHVQRLVIGTYQLVEDHAAQFLFRVESVAVVDRRLVSLNDKSASLLAARLYNQLSTSFEIIRHKST